jgi:glutamyl-tRNA reductase
MERAFQEIHLFTWNYADHDLACLADFPDSRSFYSVVMKKPDHISSFLFVSTCNRIEIYIETAHRKHALELDEIKEIFKDTPAYKGLCNHMPVYKRGLDSVRHLFQVAAGLKSMALGETQITGQLKRDFTKAYELGYISSFFNSLIQKVFECQKKIRTQTDIGRNPVSLVSLLEKEMIAIHNDQPLNLSRVAIGGTGDMSEKVVRYFLNKKVNRFVIIRNDISKELPSAFKTMLESEKQKKEALDVQFVNWSDLWVNQQPFDFSVMVTSTHADQPLLNLEKISLMKANGFLNENAIVADLGIPPNIDTDGIDIEKHNIINLDRLLKQSKINKNLRGLHYREALPIIEKSIHVFWMDYLYSKNPELVNTVLKQVEKESKDEWSNLLSGPLKNITEKQKRILVDYMKKQERKALRTHKELFVDMLTIGEEERLSVNLR